MPRPLAESSSWCTEAPLLHEGCVTLGKCPPLSGPRAAPRCWRKPTAVLCPSCGRQQGLLFPQEEGESGSGPCFSGCLGLILSFTQTRCQGRQEPPGRSPVSLGAYCVSPPQKGRRRPTGGLGRTRAWALPLPVSPVTPRERRPSQGLRVLVCKTGRSWMTPVDPAGVACRWRSALPLPEPSPSDEGRGGLAFVYMGSTRLCFGP